MKIRSVRAELFHVDGLTDATKLMVTYSSFTNSPKMLSWLWIMVLFQRFTRILKPNTDFIQLFFSLHLMPPFSFLSSSDHMSLNLYAIICIGVVSGTIICWNLHWHVLTSVAVPFFIYHQILYMSPCSTCKALPMREIPCLMCRPVTAMGVKVTWVMEHLHGPANTLWVHFTAALSWPVTLVEYVGWKDGALGLKNKTTKKNLREEHGFCPITLLPAW